MRTAPELKTFAWAPGMRKLRARNLLQFPTKNSCVLWVEITGTHSLDARASRAHLAPSPADLISFYSDKERKMSG